MAESLSFSDTRDRQILYAEIVPQIEALVSGETDIIANLANVTAALKQAFGFFWVGFYLLKDGQLVLGPFQGPVACTRIDLDKGVCGHAFSTGEVTIVADVDAFPGHIACSSAARSEIVVPIYDLSHRPIGVLDVDSDVPDGFTDADADGLGRIARIVGAAI